MKKILAFLFLYAILCIIGSVHAYPQNSIACFSASNPYCGDDLCTSGETCKTCIWDCGVCNKTDEEGSGGGYIGTAPEKKKALIWDEQKGKYLEYPIDARSYLKSNSIQNLTEIRLRMSNTYDSPTPSIRLHLEATMSWFKPKELSYAFSPDGYTKEGWPYWDIPPLAQNESIEILINVNGSVGFANLIDVKTESLDRWGQKCGRLAPDNSASSGKRIADFLAAMNQSSNATVYHEETITDGNGTIALVYIDSLEMFGIFELNSTNVSIVSDRSSIAALVSNYSTQKSLQTNQSKLNVSIPYKILSYAKNAKQGPEKSCRIITGMEKFKCVDRESCFYSCFSVPVCSMIANGWPFIDTLLDYNKSIDSANSALDKSIDSAQAFSLSPSYESASFALGDMGELNKKETKVVYHPLFTTYNFCQPADYAMPQQLEAKRVLLDYLDENCLHGEESGIVNQSVRFASLAANITMSDNASSIQGNATSNISIQIPFVNLSDGNQSDINQTENASQVSQTPGIKSSRCCISSLCSIIGIEKIAGICWEWWVLFFGIIIISISFLIRRYLRPKAAI